jgi:hypothetical protein
MTATAAPAAAVPYRPAGNAASRVNRWKIVLIALIGLAIVVGVANVVLLINEPGPAQPDCQPDRPCIPPVNRDAVSLGRRWVSRDLGFSFEYPTGWLRLASEDGASVRLEIPTDAFQSEVWISGARASDSSIEELVRQRRDALSQRVVGLQEDNDSPERVVSPSLGFVRGVGGSYAGTLDSGSGPTAPATTAIMAAGDGNVNVVLSFLIAGEGLSHKQIQQYRMYAGSLVVSTMKWR